MDQEIKDANNTEKNDECSTMLKCKKEFIEMFENKTNVILKSIKNEGEKIRKYNDKKLIEYQAKVEDLEKININLSKTNAILSEQCKDFEKKIQEKTTEYDKVKNDSENAIRKLNEKNEKLEKQILDVKKQNEIYLEEYDEINEKYRKFNSIDSAFSLFQDLPESIKTRMENIFDDSNILRFVVKLKEWVCIEGLWGFIKRRIIEDEKESLDKLKKLFILVFDIYRDLNANNRYSLYEPSIGEKFDSDKHSIIGTKTDGYIDETLLNGIFDNVNNKCLFKAIVKVSGGDNEHRID